MKIEKLWKGRQMPASRIIEHSCTFDGDPVYESTWSTLGAGRWAGPPGWGCPYNPAVVVLSVILLWASQFKFRWKFPKAYAVLAHSWVNSHRERANEVQALAPGSVSWPLLPHCQPHHSLGTFYSSGSWRALWPVSRQWMLVVVTIMNF